MNNRKIKLIQALGLSLTLSACIGNNDSHNEQAAAEVTQGGQHQSENSMVMGMAGDYYAKPGFQDFLFSSLRKNGMMTLDNEEQQMFAKRYAKANQNTIRSARWQGHIKFDKPGRYFVELQQNGQDNQLDKYQINISVNGRSVSRKANSPIVINTSDKLYKVVVEISGNTDLKTLDNLQLVNINADSRKSEVINANHMYATVKNAQAGDAADGGSDTAKLDIHKNALNGFIILPMKNGNLILGGWMPTDYANGETKYFASSSDIDTTLTGASPWTDDQKIFGAAEQSGVSTDALNPVVAAYPIVKPILAGFTVTDNKNVSMSFNTDNTHGTNFSNGNSTNHEEGNSNNVSATLDISKTPKLDLSYSHSWNTSDSSSSNSEWGSSNSVSINHGIESSFNPAEEARLVYALKFKNYGTAPITNFSPKLNLGSISDNAKVETIVSTPMQDGKSINFLAANSTYPAGMPLLIGTEDSFNSSKIMIDQYRYNLLKNPNSRIKVDIAELSQQNDADNQWGPTLARLPQVTARLILRTPHQDVERRVFAQSESSQTRYKQPELNLRDGLYTAFKLIQQGNSKIYNYKAKFNDPQQLDDAEYTFKDVAIIADAKTGEKLNKMPSKSELDSNSLKLRPHMNFVITPLGWVENNTTHKRSYATRDHGFYRNEAAKIEGNYYLFDEKAELVEKTGIVTVQRGEKTYTYNMEKKGNEYKLISGFYTVENTTTAESLLTEEQNQLWKTMIKEGVVDEQASDNTISTPVIHEEKLTVYITKNDETYLRELQKIGDNLDIIAKSCTVAVNQLYCPSSDKVKPLANKYLGNGFLKMGVLTGAAGGPFQQLIPQPETISSTIIEENQLKKEYIQKIETIHTTLSSQNAIKGQKKDYYFNPEMKTGWINNGKDSYFADSNGVIVKNKIEVIKLVHGVNTSKPDGIYYFDDHGIMQKNYTYNEFNGIYRFDENGQALTNREWRINGKTYQFGNNGNAMLNPHATISSYELTATTLNALDANNQKITSTPLTNLFQAIEHAKNTSGWFKGSPLFVWSNKDKDSSFSRKITIQNGLDQATALHLNYQGSSSNAVDVTAATNKTVSNFATKGKLWQNPLIISWPLNNNNDKHENCYLTLYSSGKHDGVFHADLVDFTVFAAKGTTLPLSNEQVWTEIHYSGYINEPADKDIASLNLGVYLEGNIFRVKFAHIEAVSNTNLSKPYTANLGICSIK